MKTFGILKIVIIVTASVLICVSGGLIFNSLVEREDEHVHTFGEWTVTAEATCTQDGSRERVCECGEKDIVEIKAAHIEVTDASVAPTCTEDGLTEGKHCDRCGEVLVIQTVVSATGHEETLLTSVAPTCTEKGLTEGSHCSLCGEVFVAQEETEALGHAVVIDAAVEADCTTDGLTEGSHCDRCGEVLVAQETILAHHTFDETSMKLNVSADGREATIDAPCLRCDSSDPHPYTGVFVREFEAFMFNAGQRVDITEQLLETEGKTYYVINNTVQRNIIIILENRVYCFDKVGLLSDKVLDREEVTVDGKAYYVVNNVICKNVYARINNNIYFYGADGVRSTEILSYREVEVDGDVYYVINNIIQKNVYVRIENKVFFYGGDGAKSAAPLTQREVTVGDVVYYVVNNEIQINVYVIVDNKIFFYGADGSKSGEPLTEREITVNGDVYYVINNVIQKNVYVLIENKIFFYGEDGSKSGSPITEKEVTDIKGNTYYVVNNEIQINVYAIVDGKIFFYGADGRKSNEPLTEREVAVGGVTYYVINNKIQINVFVLMGDKVAFYGEDGSKSDETITEKEITDIKGNTYYVINNTVQKNVYVIIENKIFFYGDDGSRRGEPLTEREITVGGVTYYVVNNVIQKNVYVLIENMIFFYGENGGKSDEPITEKEVTDIKGNTYYVINNVIRVNVYVLIGDEMCFYGDDGVKSSDTITNREVTDKEGRTYYVVNNEIQKNVYVLIENMIFFYGENGEKSDEAINGERVSAINGRTYYVINNVIQKNIYVFISNRIYFFGSDGTGLINGSVGGYTFGPDGEMLGTNVFITIDEILYEVDDGYADVHSHSYSSSLTQPTCTTGGYTTHTCLCGHSYDDGHTDPLGHNYGSLIPTIEPTCMSEGRKAYYQCDRCDAIFTEGKTLTTMSALRLDKVYHDFVSDVCRHCQIRRTVTTGRVFRANSGNVASHPIVGARIILSGTDDKGLPFTAECTTDSNGAYSIAGIPFGTYNVRIEMSGYCTNKAVMRVYYPNQVQENIYLVPVMSDVLGYASGKAINAKTGGAISGISIYVRKGTNVTSGEYVAVLTTDAYGGYSTAGLAEGNYTLQFVDNRGTSERFASDHINVAILSGISIGNQNITLSQAVVDGGIRVVLTWGSTPGDLDSHMKFGYSGTNYHVYYSNKSSYSVSLDVDDTSAYGPETITVSSINQSYTYNYYVYNYSGGSSSVLSSSAARVTIYSGDKVLYSIPVPSGSGRYWQLFSYSAENGFTIYNTISSSLPW